MKDLTTVGVILDLSDNTVLLLATHLDSEYAVTSPEELFELPVVNLQVNVVLFMTVDIERQLAFPPEQGRGSRPQIFALLSLEYEFFHGNGPLCECSGFSNGKRSCGNSDDDDAVRNVISASHNRTGAGLASPAQLERRDQDGAAADQYLLLDCGLVFLFTVIVREHRARAHVDMITDVRVANIREMPDFGAGSDIRVFYFDKISDTRAAPQNRTDTQT